MNLDRTCDAYLDRRMTSAEAERFQVRLVRDPELAAAVELHTDVGDSLRRTMAVPDLTGLLHRIDAAAAQMRAGGRNGVEGSIRWVAAAASLLFLCLAMCASTVLTPHSDAPKLKTQRSWRASLAEVVSLSLATASAVVASGARLRRDDRRRFEGSGREGAGWERAVFGTAAPESFQTERRADFARSTVVARVPAPAAYLLRRPSPTRREGYFAQLPTPAAVYRRPGWSAFASAGADPGLPVGAAA